MRLVHLTASTFFGGPERQMLGLAEALRPHDDTRFLLFPEGGRYQPFRDEIRRRGFDADVLDHDTPRVTAAASELARRLRGADLLLCHGYKPNLLGRTAARWVGVPAVAVSRGWTSESWKVWLYETADRLHLRQMDLVVCVSKGQAAKVRRAGVPSRRIRVIRNAARDLGPYAAPPLKAAAREELQRLFPTPPQRLVIAAGRLSPEKGFGVLIEAAAAVCLRDPSVGFVQFGEGGMREALQRQIDELGLRKRFVLAGFRGDLDRLWPAADLAVLPSFTEGLPNVLLEAASAGVPAVATAVGGTPEVVADGVTGWLVPPGEPVALAQRIHELLSDAELRSTMGHAARDRMQREFTFAAQAAAYRRLFAERSLSWAA